MTYRKPSTETYGQKRVRKCFRFSERVITELDSISAVSQKSRANVIECLVTKAHVDNQKKIPSSPFLWRFNSSPKPGVVRKQKNFRIDAHVLTCLDELCHIHRTSQAGMIEELVKDCWKKMEEGNLNLTHLGLH